MLDEDRIERGYGSQALWLDRELTSEHVGFQPEELATVSSSIGHVLLHASVADPSMRLNSSYKALDLVELYEEAPYVETRAERNMVGLQPGRTHCAGVGEEATKSYSTKPEVRKPRQQWINNSPFWHMSHIWHRAFIILLRVCYWSVL